MLLRSATVQLDLAISIGNKPATKIFRTCQLSGNSALGLTTEVDQVCELTTGRNLGRNSIQSIADCQPFSKHNLIRLPQPPLHFFGHTSALQPHLVDAARLRGIAVGYHVWRHVLHHFRATADDRHRPNPAELMDRRQTADHDVILHQHVPGKRPAIAEDNLTSHLTVVRHVRVREKVAVRPDPRYATVIGRRVDGNMLAEHIIGTDLKVTLAALVLQILRLQADARERVKLAPRPDRGQTVEDHVRMQPALVAEIHIRSDDAVGPNLATVANLRAQINDGCRVDDSSRHVPPHFYTNPVNRSTSRAATLPPLTAQAGKQ